MIKISSSRLINLYFCNLLFTKCINHFRQTFLSIILIYLLTFLGPYFNNINNLSVELILLVSRSFWWGLPVISFSFYFHKNTLYYLLQKHWWKQWATLKLIAVTAIPGGRKYKHLLYPISSHLLQTLICWIKVFINIILHVLCIIRFHEILSVSLICLFRYHNNLLSLAITFVLKIPPIHLNSFTFTICYSVNLTKFKRHVR